MKTIGRVVMAGLVTLAFVTALGGCGSRERGSQENAKTGDGAAKDTGDRPSLAAGGSQAQSDAAGPEAVKLTDGDEGEAVTLKVGQTLEIRLESNPTTGFGWEVLEIDPAVVEQEGETVYEASKTDGHTVGSGGWETFTFKAVEAGTVELKLVYRRSWEVDVAPEKTFTVTVTVEE
ncbi:MAG: protease inhibitor I42 family protein [Verrucomicrobia bacterium]|nr:protease inhibitor I42 family protein [Verrucomicrobiota bacterium]